MLKTKSDTARLPRTTPTKSIKYRRRLQIAHYYHKSLLGARDLVEFTIERIRTSFSVKKNITMWILLLTSSFWGLYYVTTYAIYRVVCEVISSFFFRKFSTYSLISFSSEKHKITLEDCLERRRVIWTQESKRKHRKTAVKEKEINITWHIGTLEFCVTLETNNLKIYSFPPSSIVFKEINC